MLSTTTETKTVKDLIAILQELPPTATIYCGNPLDSARVFPKLLEVIYHTNEGNIELIFDEGY